MNGGSSWPRRAGAMAFLALAMAVAVTSCGSGKPEALPSADRVLVISLPGVTWREVQGSDLPNLERLFERSSVGAVSTRIGRRAATTTAAYLTLGAGTRAVVPPIDTAVALNPDELHAGIPASELMRRRLGKVVEGIAYIPVGAAIDVNERSPFGAEPGRLGDELRSLGVHRTVIANADAAEGFPVDEVPPDGAYSRSAATMMMGSDGVVPGGSVGRGLLVDDPDAAFGRRLDHTAVLEVFDEQWQEGRRSVALVEASDLARVAAYASRSTPAQARELRARALADADRLVGSLLERADLERDAVIVLAPLARNTLGVASLAGPGVEGGYLTSASTRRDGYVYLADVAPTILELVGAEPPDDIEGRPFDLASASGDRIAQLAGESADAAVRDARLPVVVPVIIVALVLLAIAVAKRDALPRWARSLLRPAAMACLGLVPGTFVAATLEVTGRSDGAYWIVVLTVALLVGLVAGLVDRWRPGLGALVAVGSVVAVIGLDVLAGAPMQVNAVFGYSMAVAGRFTGVGNLAFALFAAAVVCAAVLTYERYGRRALGVVLGGLVVAVAIDGLPMLGADVGGVLSLVPALFVTVAVLVGRRVTWRTVAAGFAAGLVVVALFGLIDASRPPEVETHLARIGEHLLSGRVDRVATIGLRRLEASFGAQTMLLWLVAIAMVGFALLQARARADGWRARLPRPAGPTDSGTTALVIGLGTLAVLGLVANDSSVAVPATMLIVAVPVLALRATDPGATP